MRRRLRRGLIWTLAVALTVAGLPLAHAQNCGTLQVEPAQHAHHHDMQMDDAAAMDPAPAQPHDNSRVATPCKCLNCSSLCAAFVAPLPHLLKIERRVDATVYPVRDAVQRGTTVVIDPGIPIAA